MCGINGIFAYNPVASCPDEGELLRTRDAMAKRGPDGAGTWWSADRRCAFGHRRLSIIDLSDRALQPMTSDDGRYVITFNGEIYNFPDLRKALEARGARFRTTSDTEALLHLYARYGGDMVHHLRGMFAIAIWDTDRRGLFLARDPYGIKPLYVSDMCGTFRFASQVKALLAGGAVSKGMDPAGLVGFCLYGNVPEPFTAYRDVAALPAGHTQWIDANGANPPEPFARVADILARTAPRKESARDFRERVRAEALDSVRAHLLADVEVGLFLSAGVDSGAMLGLMRDATEQTIRAITLSFSEFEGTHDDEVPLAAKAADAYGAHHVIRRVTKAEFDSDVPAIFEAMDQPSIDGINAWFVAKAARDIGLKVALSGLGGDELLAGYSSFGDLPRWRRTVSPFMRNAALRGTARAILKAFFPVFAARKPKLVGVLDYADSWPGLYLLRRGLFLPSELPTVIDADIAKEGLARLDPLAALEASITPDPGSDVARICALESSNYMRNQLLRDTDWASMAHSLEVRVPLVDITLLKGLAPSIHRLQPRAGKVALAAAPSRPLPEETVARAKTGFIVPTGIWMESRARRNDPPARHRLPHGIASRSLARYILEQYDPPRSSFVEEAASVPEQPIVKPA